eukprot:scaffold1988_cov255-Pinguiococcus_pyrenoidosus.AAC.11
MLLSRKGGTIVVDPSLSEEQRAHAVLTLSMLSPGKKATQVLDRLGETIACILVARSSSSFCQVLSTGALSTEALREGLPLALRSCDATLLRLREILLAAVEG